MKQLKRFDEGTWHDLPDYPGTRLKIKPLSQKDRFDALGDARRKVIVSGTMAETREEGFHDGVLLWGQFRRALMEWEGLQFNREKPTREEMLLDAFNDDEIRIFVLKVADQTGQAEETKLKDEIKNSESSQPG